MRLSIRHTTRYLFDTPVVHALQRLRLTPKQTQGQEILEWEMEYHNAHPEFVYEDQHHNTVNLVSVETGAQEVTVTCRGQTDRVTALLDRPRAGQVVIHNHPSGILQPSTADMELASLYGENGVGVVIVPFQCL